MKEFKVGDGFVYCPGNEVYFLKITKIGRWNKDKKCKSITFNRYLYDNNVCEEDKYETGKALIVRDESKNKEYVQVDHWLTKKYCVRHIVYCE